MGRLEAYSRKHTLLRMLVLLLSSLFFWNLTTLYAADEDNSSNVALEHTCDVFPITFSESQLSNVSIGDALLLSNDLDDGYSLLTWSGSQSNSKLRQSLTFPGNSEIYSNPTNPDDSELSIEDWVSVYKKTKLNKKVREKLNALSSREILVPIWDDSQDSVNIKVSGFAKIILDSVDPKSKDNSLPFVFAGFGTCGDENVPPVAEDISYSVEEDNILIALLNASDEEGSALSYAIITQPQNGVLTVDGGNVTYTPTLDFSGFDSFTYKANDGELESNVATVSITVTPNNDAPVALEQSLNTIEDQAVEFILTSTDVDSSDLVYEIFEQPIHGTLSGAIPNIIYTPNANFNGEDIFSFISSDGLLDSEPAEVTINIAFVNDAPVVQDISLSLNEDQTSNVVLTGIDVEGDALEFSVQSQPSNGVLSGESPNFVYTPNSDFEGTDSFTVVANDGELSSAPATIELTVVAVNDAPQVSDQTLTADEDSTISFELSATDVDNVMLSYNITTQPVNGTLSGNLPNLIYTPTANFNGSDSLMYSVSDGELDSETVTISFTVNPVNDAPVSQAQDVSLDEDGTLAITLSANDVDGDVVTLFTVTSQTSNGTLSGDIPNLSYAPNANYNGTDTFTFISNDGDLDSEPATISIDIISVNDAPSVADQTATVDQGEAISVQLAGVDIDEDSTLSFSVVSNPTGGVLSGAAPALTYTANSTFVGTDTFTFIANDGELDSAIGTVAITVNEVVITDPDTDGDGVPDNVDAFPNDPNESADLDGDGTGDNADTDRDGDGVENDADAFPNDSTETADLDGDGIGDNADPDRDGDGVLNVDDFFPDDGESSTVPTVTITTPDSLITVGSSPITVTGTIDDPAARLTVNGVEITPTNGTFEVDVALEEGLNTIVARGIDAKNHEGLATIIVSLDKTPPYVTVATLEEGQTVYTDKIAVGGLVNDIVRGTVTEDDAIVRVNGQLAAVSNRSYLAEDVQLTVGENTIEIVASDAVGNVGNAFVTINYEVQTNKIIERVSGQSQSAEISTPLAAPLLVRLTDEGVPVVDKAVIFRVVEGDGLLQNGIDQGANGAVVQTDTNGVASVNFTLGSRAGVGNHRVRARAVGFDGEVVFNANATYGSGVHVGVIAGNNQRGSVRQPLPSPMVLAVTDTGANLIPDADIEFKVTQGTGKFQNGLDTYLTKTDKDGRASVQFTLGAEEGLDQQRVTATLVGTNASSGFTVSGFMPGDPGQTSITGVVLDNQDTPMPNVTIRVDGSNRQAVSDDQGQFEITQAPVGPVHLLVEGSTTTLEGEWPTLSYNIVTVPGVANPLASPIYLVELDTESAMMVGAEDVEYTLPDVPGFKLKVKSGSVTFPDGSNTGLLSVTAVNANKIPMPPPNGMQPQFIITIQPHGAMFDEPAELTLPNVDGHAPGREVEMYSYDHDLEEFVTIGLGTVSRDGSVITSNPGVGVVKAGWHCGSPPGGDGCAAGLGGSDGGPGACLPECGTLVAESGASSCGDGGVQTRCELKDNPNSIPLIAQDSSDCKIDTCGEPIPDPNGMPFDLTPAGNCKKSICNGVNIDGAGIDDSDKPLNVDGTFNFCQDCSIGNVVNSNEGVNLPSDQCKVCKGGSQVAMSIDVKGPLNAFINQSENYSASSLDGVLPSSLLSWSADGGVVSGTGSSISVIFNAASTSPTDLKKVKSSCNINDGSIDVCVVDSLASPPQSVNLTYLETIITQRPVGATEYGFVDPQQNNSINPLANDLAFDIDITSYYDPTSNSWKPKVTSANMKYDIYYDLLPGQLEANANVATAANCQQMIFDLNTLAQQNPVPQWYSTDAVEAHERVHVADLKRIMNAEFSIAKAAIESLSWPHTCGNSQSDTRIFLINDPGYLAAINTARTRATSAFIAIPDPNPQLDAAERVVVNQIISQIRAKANLPANVNSWPAVCK